MHTSLPTLTSTVSALLDLELLAQTRALAGHEQALQILALDHLREIESRRLYLRLGFSSLFDYAARELEYSDGAAWRHINAMRFCSDKTLSARERLEDGSLSLSAAAQLPNNLRALGPRRGPRSRPRHGARGAGVVAGRLRADPGRGAGGGATAGTAAEPYSARRTG